MPTHEIEFRVPEFNQWPLNCQPQSSVVCVSMEKARGDSNQDTGRPQNEGATQLKITIFFGRDEEAREVEKLSESTTSWTRAASYEAPSSSFWST